MELPRRARGDEYLPDGAMTRMLQRLSARPSHADIRCLVVYAFDFRTRMLPFLFADTRMAPAGARAVGSALYHSGFTRTRVVLQQWNPNIRPSECLIDGAPPDVLLVSSMQIHASSAYAIIRDAHTMGDRRPLIIAGGPKAIYEPEHLFTLTPRLHEPGEAAAALTGGVDIAVTGEEFITLELLDVLTGEKGSGETMLQAFRRCAAERSLEHIPGLVYADPAPPEGPRLLNTGIQRLLRNLDELPDVVTGFRLLEPPSRRRGIGPAPLPDRKIYTRSPIASLITTHGCKFACNYCPIPAYNQRTWRIKSPAKVAEDAARIHEAFGIRYFFGTDDNFFNSRSSVEEFFTTVARAEYKGKPVRQNFRFGTEATEFDVYKNRDLLPMAKKAGLFGIWFGIEDMTAELIKKGQTPEKTKELFAYMGSLGIAPMAMMMHHDGQPLLSRGSLRGLLNQANFLFNAGAVSFQCTILSPAVGTKVFEDTFKSGTMLRSMDGKILDECYYDGNHAVATSDPKPWRRQLNLLAAYASFYNPVNLMRRLLFGGKNRTRGFGYQFYGLMALPKTAIEMTKWAWKLATGKLDYWQEVPDVEIPMVWVNEPGGRRPVSKAVREYVPQLVSSAAG